MPALLGVGTSVHLCQLSTFYTLSAVR